MKFKLDENLGKRTLQIFRTAGHNATTVLEQGIGGCRDQFLYDHCRREERCLVTLDLDFSNVLRFSPKPTAGIAVFRPQKNRPSHIWNSSPVNLSSPFLRNQLPDVYGLSNRTGFAFTRTRNRKQR